MNIPIQNIYYLLCYAWDKLAERDVVAVEAIDTTTLADLFARVLINGTNHLLKRGFDRGYVAQHEWTGRLRGRICFQEAITRNATVFYMGTPNTTPAPDYIPAFPYLTLKARAVSPTGPWTKQPDVIPFRTKRGAYYSATASPGHVIAHDGGYLMFFSASTDAPIRRTLGIARTKGLNGPWHIDSEPVVPLAEQVENSSLYYEPANRSWWLFTNHVGLRDGLEYTDAIWVYWTTNLDRWDPAHKAVILDSKNCKWSRHIIGLPSAVQVGRRLAIFYDCNAAEQMPPGVKSHMNRDVGLAWLDLPLVVPTAQ